MSTEGNASITWMGSGQKNCCFLALLLMPDNARIIL
jgi:hypothetical protein